MNLYVRAENTEYQTVLAIQDKTILENGRMLASQTEMIRLQTGFLNTMEGSLRVMAETIERQERELRALQPGREYGYAIAMDRNQILHSVMIQYPEDMEFPVEQELIDLVADQALNDSDTDSDITIMEEDNEI